MSWTDQYPNEREAKPIDYSYSAETFPNQPSLQLGRIHEQIGTNSDDFSCQTTDIYNNQKVETKLYSISLRGQELVCLEIDGRQRVCLAQISSTLLRHHSYNEIHNRRVALGIICVQCSPTQLEALRDYGAMPASSRRCGTITMREAQRLVKSFLDEPEYPKLPENFIFDVVHQCGWGCEGQFVPGRYNSSRAKCVRCNICQIFFSPNKFIFHSHPPLTLDSIHETKYQHPDAANFNAWRRHLFLAADNPALSLIYAWEDVKAMFNGGNRKRYMSHSRLESRPSSEDSDNKDEYFNVDIPKRLRYIKSREHVTMNSDLDERKFNRLERISDMICKQTMYNQKFTCNTQSFVPDTQILNINQLFTNSHSVDGHLESLKITGTNGSSPVSNQWISNPTPEMESTAKMSDNSIKQHDDHNSLFSNHITISKCLQNSRNIAEVYRSLDFQSNHPRQSELIILEQYFQRFFSNSIKLNFASTESRVKEEVARCLNSAPSPHATLESGDMTATSTSIMCEKPENGSHDSKRHTIAQLLS